MSRRKYDFTYLSDAIGFAVSCSNMKHRKVKLFKNPFCPWQVEVIDFKKIA